MAEPSDPPRREFRFKPTTFETVNAGVPASEGPESAQPDPGPRGTESAKVDLRDILRDANRGVPACGSARDRDNEVRGTLREHHDQIGRAHV